MTKIRIARVEDCSKLAEIMRDRSDIAFTDADVITSRLQKNGFGEDPVFECFVAEEDTTAAPGIIGYAMVSRIYSSWEGKSLRLGDLYVAQDRRRKGIGTELLRRVMKECEDQGCRRIDCCPQLVNEALISFLKKHGAKDIMSQDGWSYYQLSYDDMQKLAGRT
ncbi:thialysine N-epsilon-acetyltransferase-like isoform X1 [Dermacentor andersoni]|uniref:thialysine N-epsilon-acetyltransferase-like isoform X1 n=1 Tax=Dermacentor andersoni TaxID=34620 RepID=UPI00215521CA|nr:thialysine N-epsilon-acetyltransferase-like isoform X1 [Dermacentor andersoni]